MSSRTETLLVFACLWTAWCQVNGDLTLVAENVTLDQNSSIAILECSVNMTREDVKLSWFKGEKEVVPDERHLIDSSNVSYTSLRINRVDKNDVGVYECRATIDGIMITKEVVLYASPRILKHALKSITLVEGNALTAKCVSWGWPAPTLTWERLNDNMPHGLDSHFNVTVVSKGSMTNLTLSAESVNLSDRGYYRCTAKNVIDGVDHPAVDKVFIRVKAAIAPLWPFIGILIEILLLVVVIFIYEWQKKKKQAAAERKEN